MGTIVTNLLVKVAHNTISLLITLCVLASANEIAGYYHLTTVQSSLTALKGIVVTESNTTVVTAPSTTVVVSGTVVSATTAQ